MLEEIVNNIDLNFALSVVGSFLDAVVITMFYHNKFKIKKYKTLIFLLTVFYAAFYFIDFQYPSYIKTIVGLGLMFTFSKFKIKRFHYFIIPFLLSGVIELPIFLIFQKSSLLFMVMSLLKCFVIIFNGEIKNTSVELHLSSIANKCIFLFFIFTIYLINILRSTL